MSEPTHCDYCGKRLGPKASFKFSIPSPERKTRYWCMPCSDNHAAERAVIEAAEKLLPYLSKRARTTTTADEKAVWALVLATEALQATRDPVPLDKVKTWEEG